MQDAKTHLGFAPQHFFVYRRQHRLPIEPWSLMITLARSYLTVVMNTCYAMQTGKQKCTLIARHRAPLLALGAALADACEALGDVFVQNADARCVAEWVGGLLGCA